MIKKGLFILALGIVAVLVFTNYNYPFVTQTGGRWSVGFTATEKVFPRPEIPLENVIPYSKLESLTGEEKAYIADPFFIKEKGVFYLFVELKGSKNADIALFTSVDGNNYIYKGIVLDEDFHLSYPQVFKYKSNFYMLPETKQAGQVLLYKAENFPYKWKIQDTLIKNVKLKDPSILVSPNLNLIVAVDDHLQQYIFTADSLDGKWNEAENYIPKLGNETRPGGRFFKMKNSWYLPVQDRSGGYGYGISLYKLDTLNNKLKFKLAKKDYLGPLENIKWFNRGMHQLDVQNIGDKYYMVYDGDRSLDGETYFQVKRSFRFLYYDVINFFQKLHT